MDAHWLSKASHHIKLIFYILLHWLSDLPKTSCRIRKCFIYSSMCWDLHSNLKLIFLHFDLETAELHPDSSMKSLDTCRCQDCESTSLNIQIRWCPNPPRQGNSNQTVGYCLTQPNDGFLATTRSWMKLISWFCSSTANPPLKVDRLIYTTCSYDYNVMYMSWYYGVCF